MGPTASMRYIGASQTKSEKNAMAGSKEDRDRVERKRAALAAKIKEIAPHADTMLGLLDESRLDMALLGLNIGFVELRDEG